MKLLIAIYHPFELWTAPAWLVERLRERFPKHNIVQLPGPRYEGLEREILDADAMVGWSIRPEQFMHAEKLRWIHSPAAAVHQLMFPEMVASDVVITNAREVHGPVVAEHAVAVMFALAKRLPSAMRYQQQKIWAQKNIWEEKPTAREIAGATVCVIGMGSIGREFATRAQALGMNVIAVREHPERGGDVNEVVGMDELEHVLPRADYVLLAAPLTKKTEHMINGARLRLMKPDAYLINVSRGPLIDDDALIAALRRKRIAGAALDVFAEEPLPSDSPYWSMDNVLITPHTAAVTEKLWERHFEMISENFERFISGKPLLHVVDKRRGY
jgi:phosphoglycerate dehydrogenase-like enzyme